ncbi:D-inositol-3-phosphate glycosyltransferase [Abditibacteriota bacterium]|nr:D-inositol-3-phosphate glycosyltransferase [Abditibacteriota bacterium]
MNILFVAHAATRGGAAGVLLELLRFIERETPHKSTVLTVRGGPLEAEFVRAATPFAEVAPFRLATRLAGAKRRVDEMDLPFQEIVERLLDGAMRVNTRRARRVARECPRFDVVYVNSVASGEAVKGLEPLLRRGTKLVVHVHEMAFALSQNEPGWSFLKRRGDLFIAVSKAVYDELVKNQGLAPVVVVREWVDFEKLQTDRTAARHALRLRIGAPEEAVVIGGCGTIEPRKGTDWWVQSAFYALNVEPNARKSPAPLHFVWLGGGDNVFARGIERDVQGYGIGDRVHFLPTTREPKEFFAGLDGFLLASREDPFPLVAVEAAAQSVPILCFENGGGAVELVGENGGVMAPWGDCAGMGRALASLGLDSDFREQLGRNVYKRALGMCDTSKNCARVVELLESAVTD